LYLADRCVIGLEINIAIAESMRSLMQLEDNAIFNADKRYEKAEAAINAKPF
jgi:hypothetical protein